MFLILFLFSLLSNDHMEKCSESRGIKFVLFFFNSFLINFHPQIIDSLFAIPKLCEYFITSKVGSSPLIPDMPLIAK